MNKKKYEKKERIICEKFCIKSRKKLNEKILQKKAENRYFPVFKLIDFEMRTIFFYFAEYNNRVEIVCKTI